MKDTVLFQKGLDWLVASGVNLVVNLLIFALILIIGKYVIRAVLRAAELALKRAENISQMLRGFALNVLSKALWVVLLMLALPRLGVEVGPLIAGVGVAGFVAGFAFQESLSNLAAGVMLLINEPFKLGDFVEAGGHSGEIKALNMMATTMFTGDNRVITIPNKSVWGGPVVNYSKNKTRRIDMSVGVAYSTDIPKALQVIGELLGAEPRILKEPAPQIELASFGESSIELIARPWVEAGDYWPTRFAFNQNVKAAFQKNGLEMPFPQLDVHHKGIPSGAEAVKAGAA